jgi:SAM-dependent methyltransferase
MPDNHDEASPGSVSEADEALVARIADKMADRVWPILRAKLEAEKPWKKNIFIPDMEVYGIAPESDFMRFSTCAARDFFHPEFRRIAELMKIPLVFHRKYWEWVFVFHHIVRELAGALSGKRGLGFGVGGTEPLSAGFAKYGALITATDAPASIGDIWASGGAYASGADALPCEGIIERPDFRERVSFREVDMNDIPADMTGYDFCWSSCCFEHLGDLNKGLEFVINSVERTLKVGGVACHTTELNLSSNDRTIDSGPAVMYRRRDIDGLIEALRSRGHEASEFWVAPDSVAVDGYVDTPPYSAPPHLKLDLGGFTSTSAGIVVRRGR